MPEHLTHDEINSQTDPSVAKQYDSGSSKEDQIKEFFELVDSKKIAMLTTHRDGVGLVGRSMAVAKRVGPDVLFLANQHSRKFSDISKNKQVQVTFQDLKSQDWASISGSVTTSSSSDPRIKDLWSQSIKAWFGDLGDGKHDGGPEDPRVTLIEVKSNYATYYATKTSKLGALKEVGVAAVTGQVANIGVLRELNESDLEQARSMD